MRRVGRTAAVLLVTAALPLMSACRREERAPIPATGAVGATVEAVVTKPEAYLDKRVMVSGEIEKIYAKNAFTIGGREFIFEDRLLVLTPHDFTNVADQPGGAGLNEDDLVQATGMLRRLDVAEIEREIGWDLAPELEVAFRSAPVLIVSGLQTSPRKPAAQPGIGGGPALNIETD